jgi:uncharacterized membrane protein YcaP (DUF421 family)
MGKRQIGELDVFDLVSTLIISELAAIPISDPDIPLLFSAIPILFIISAEILISAIKNRFNWLKRAVEGTPAYIIYKGRLLQNALTDNRISINELIGAMREQGIFDISEVGYGILEQNGTISFYKSDGDFAHSLIVDGVLHRDAIRRTGMVEKVEKIVKKEGAENIMLMTYSGSGKINIIRRDKDGG